MTVHAHLTTLINALKEAQTYQPSPAGESSAFSDGGAIQINMHKNGELEPFAPEMTHASAHDKIAVSICERSANRALDSIHAVMAQTPGGQTWTPQLCIKHFKGRFNLGLAPTNTPIGYHNSEESLAAHIDTIIFALMRGTTGKPRKWTVGFNQTAYQAADLGSAALLGVALFEFKDAAKIFAGMPFKEDIRELFDSETILAALQEKTLTETS